MYLSPRLTDRGKADYEGLLEEAAGVGDDGSLADALRADGRIKAEETAVRNGRAHTKRVPVTAPETLAEGEFNRYYARAVCLAAISRGDGSVTVYRAKAVAKPREQSVAMLGQSVDATSLLEDLRTSAGVEPALGLPPGPNSGLSVRLN